MLRVLFSVTIYRDVARGSARQPSLQMCMRRQVTVDMFHNAMVLFA
jgi:hypothetical protein